MENSKVAPALATSLLRETDYPQALFEVLIHVYTPPYGDQDWTDAALAFRANDFRTRREDIKGALAADNIPFRQVGFYPMFAALMNAEEIHRYAARTNVSSIHESQHTCYHRQFTDQLAYYEAEALSAL